MTNLLLVTILVYGLPQITGHGLGQNRRNEAEGKVGKCRELRCFFKAVTSIFYENAVGRHLVIETDDNKISKTRFHSVQNFHTGDVFSTVSSYLFLATRLIHFPWLIGDAEGISQQNFLGWFNNTFVFYLDSNFVLQSGSLVNEENDLFVQLVTFIHQNTYINFILFVICCCWI